MVTGTVLPPPPPPQSPAQQRAAQAESFIDQQIRRTRRQVQGVEVAYGLLVLAASTLGYLLAAALIDHWLVAGGLGFWGRFWLMAGLVAGAGWYFASRVAPLVLHRIHPLFAAQTIEAGRPTLKNSVINFLMLRREPRGVPAMVYGAVQQRAADDLSQVQVDLVVDRRPAIRLGYVLAAVLGAACLYLVLSPKSPLVSFGRVIWPWADIPAPTRVQIDSVEPGDAAVSRGEPVQVAANVRGLAPGEEATFYYSTADGQIVEQAIPMRPLREGEPRYVVPTDSFVARQDTEYYLKAGDCTTRRFTIEVQVAPAIVVDGLTYDYPAYTGLQRAQVQGQGDIRAVEGTRVTVRATANLDIGKAEIDLNCDGRRGLPMKIDGRSATGQITLRMDRDDPSQPEYRCYQVRFSDVEGRQNRRPTRHEIQVIPDVPPRVGLTLEEREDVPEEIQLPVSGAAEFHVAAEDPDFGLKRVTFHAEKQGKSLAVPPLLDRPRSGAYLGHRGPLEAKTRFEPARLGLKPGDVVVYAAVAEDNKEPVSNRTETERRRIVIVEDQRKPPPEQQEGDGQQGQGQGQPKPGEQGAEKPKPDQPQDQPKPGEQDPQPKPQEGPQEKPQEGPGQPKPDQAQPGDPKPSEGEKPPPPGQKPEEKPQQPGGDPNAKSQPGDQGAQTKPQEEQPKERVDPESNAAEAFDEILKDQKQQEQQKGEQPKPQSKPGGDPSAKPQEAPQPGSKPDAQQNQPGAQPGEKPKPGDNPQQGQQPGAKPESGDATQPQPGTKPQAGEPGARPKPGEEPQGPQQPGDQPQPGEKQPGSEQPQPGDGQKPSDSAQKGSQPGEKPMQPIPDNDQSGAQGSKPEQKPQPGQGAQSQGQGTKEKPEPSGPSESRGNPEKKGGDTEDPKGQAGKGQPSATDQGAPSPQEDNTHREKKPGDTSQGEPSKQESQSPSISKKDSDSSSDTAGDRSGGGEEGGGQRAKQQGTGAAGSQSEADQGAKAAGQKGEGETGDKAGDQVEAGRETGKTAKKKGGQGTENRQQPGDGPGQKPQPQDRSGQEGGQRDDGKRPGSQPEGESPEKPNAHGAGNPTTGGQPQSQPDAPPPPAKPLPGADDPNLDYARKATDMALEHLRDQLQNGDSRLLEKLRWTRQDAEAFLSRWEQLKRQAAEEGAAGDARKQLEDALKDLGLRPGGTALEGGRVKPDDLRQLRESRTIQPPPQWADQFRAFKMGVRGQGEK